MSKQRYAGERPWSPDDVSPRGYGVAGAALGLLIGFPLFVVLPVLVFLFGG